jgi:hypothetical protein
VPYSWVTSIKFLNVPLLYRDIAFRVPIRKSLILLGRFSCFRPATVFKRFSTGCFRGGVVNPMPSLQSAGPDHHLWTVRHGRPYQ